MLRIAHISDLHFGTPHVPAVADALATALHKLEPNIVVASGDFTQRARPEQFQAARQFLQTLPGVPQICVPGNHDIPVFRIWERIRRPYANYRQYLSSQLDSVYCDDTVCIVALNSTSPYRAITNGRVRQRQLDLCTDAFSQAPENAVRIVVTHHHFAPAPDYERTETMPKARRALDWFHRLGVELILAGHLHRAYVGNSLDIYPPADNRQNGITIVQCGTSASRRGRAREREKNSFNLITVNHTTLTVDHYMYFANMGAFSPVGRHLFPRSNQQSLDLG